MAGYPVILKVEGRTCVVIGGGTIAEGKVTRLLDADAKVRVVAEEVTPKIRRLAEGGSIQLDERPYREGDLEGAFIAIAATDDTSVNARIFAEAESRGVPFNAVDDVAHCTFIAPAIVRNGDLILAISTEGRAPALAVRIKERLREQYGGHEYARFLELAGGLREEVAATGRSFEERAEAWYRLVDSRVLDLLREGKDDEALRVARECLSLP